MQLRRKKGVQVKNFYFRFIILLVIAIRLLRKFAYCIQLINIYMYLFVKSPIVHADRIHTELLVGIFRKLRFFIDLSVTCGKEFR